MSAKHPRQLIREAVVAILKGHTDAGDRVFKSRVRPLTSRLLPAIGVYTTEQTSDTEETSPRKYSHTVKVHVQGIFEVDENLDDAMDALSLQVEQLLQANPTWGGTADDSALVKTSMYFVNDGRTDSGCLELEFEADFETKPGLVSESSLNDFAVAGVTYIPPTEEDPGFTDEIQLPVQPN